MGETYDFSGWATRNDLKCSDGRTIRKDAFKDNDGMTVPLVWNHQHNELDNVLGHALLENRDKGVYAYCTFNETERGANAKEMVKHGDIEALSIYANQLKQNGADVIHGAIREVSLVLAGANPGALIDNVLSHGENSEDEAIIYSGLELSHAEEEKAVEEKTEMAEETLIHAEEGQTVKDVFDTLTDIQKAAVAAIIKEIIDEKNSDQPDTKEEGETEDMKHNVFDNEERNDYLTHSDMQQIFADAKKMGSLKDAVEYHETEGVLAHAEIPTTGMTGPSSSTASQTYGFRDPDMLFPDAKSLNTPPEWIKRDTGWVTKVLNGAHHTPFSRIKSQFANITEDEARAKGYIKGKLKKEEVFSLLKRTTDPQTIYKKQKLDRDDIIDITDFDVVSWIKGEMRIMLEEELARAILIGDGRLTSDDDHISEDHIRPIYNDKPLFSVQVDVDKNSDPAVAAKNFINAAIRNRKLYKGSGNPTLFTTEDVLTEMLLMEDTIGHKLYKSEGELATALRVKEIVTVEAMEGATAANGESLLGIIVNMNDYNVGADKGGQTAMFDDFDIDYNQYKYLLETRCSGALVKPFSALVMREKATVASGT